MKTKYKIIVLLSLSFFYNFQSSIKRERSEWNEKNKEIQVQSVQKLFELSLKLFNRNELFILIQNFPY